jgi:flavin reductase (DIM6/NTAB) family NADH-FMN oxidoreductase RutF
MAVNPKLIHRLFYPQVPAVLSASYRSRVTAMPVVAYASISDTPPLVAVACSPRAFTTRLALKARSFSLSLVGSWRLRSVEKLAEVSGAAVKDKLDKVGFAHRKGTRLPVPLIEGAEATLECRLQHHIKTGDHVLLIGRVVAAHSTGAFTDFWDFGRYTPILYTGWKGGMTTYQNP